MRQRRRQYLCAGRDSPNGGEEVLERCILHDEVEGARLHESREVLLHWQQTHHDYPRRGS